MSRGRARYTQSEIERIFKAAKKVGVVARIEMEFRDGTRMAVEGKPQDPMKRKGCSISRRRVGAVETQEKCALILKAFTRRRQAARTATKNTGTHGAVARGCRASQARRISSLATMRRWRSARPLPRVCCKACSTRYQRSQKFLGRRDRTRATTSSK